MANILLCGGNGAGKTTLGRALAARTGLPFHDIEDYYFPKTDPNDPYAHPRTEEEVTALLLKDLQRPGGCIVAAVKGRYGAAEALWSCAVLVEAPRKLRLQRVRQRSFARFGERMLFGGDLFEAEERFFTMVENRPEGGTERWLSALPLPVLRVDGTLSPEENAEKIAVWLKTMA